MAKSIADVDKNMKDLGETKEQVIKMAKVAEQAERYEDMAALMKRYVIEFNQLCLEDEERNLLSVAYKNIVGAKRSSWKVLDHEERIRQEEKEATIESGGSTKTVDSKLEFVKGLKKAIKSELTEWCNDIVSVLDKYLLQKDDENQDSKVQVFYNKMKGDYFRYQVEVAEEGNERETLCNQSSAAYENAREIAIRDLDKTDPILLGLALNYSVFFYEILRNPEKACDLAKNAFEEAIPELEKVQSDKPEVFKDTALILQLLRDNLTLWNAETEDVEDD